MDNEKIFKTYDGIFGQYVSGLLSFTLFLSILAQYEKKEIQENDIFASLVLKNSFDAAILQLANLIKKNNQSVNLHYLINLIKQSKDNLDKENYKLFLEFTKEFDSDLQILSVTIDQIFILRDKTIAHIDKEHIINPKPFIEKVTATLGDLDNAYLVINDAILKIGEFLGLNKTVVSDSTKILSISLQTRVSQVFLKQKSI